MSAVVRGNSTRAWARREAYYELRRAGTPRFAAGAELGLDDRTRQRYERWWQAIAAGHEIVPSPTGHGHRPSIKEGTPR
ncbi:MAG: hypothetical protein ACLQFR_02730 [Streptosporangiaceae bacterium]